MFKFQISFKILKELVAMLMTTSLIKDLKGNLNLDRILRAMRALQSELMDLNFGVSPSNPIFFRKFFGRGLWEKSSYDD